MAAEECLPGDDYRSGKDDLQKSDSPPAIETSSTAGEQTQAEGLSSAGEVTQPPSQSTPPKRKRVASSTSGPMAEWNQAALVALQGCLKINIKMIQLNDILEKPAGGFMDRAEVLRVKTKTGDAEQMGQVIDILRGKEDEAFYRFCDLLQRSNYGVWARELKSTAERFKTEQEMPIAVKPSPNVCAMSLELYKRGIISCDQTIFESNKHPAEAIRSLYFNAYTYLIQILSTYVTAIKMVALDAVRMKQVSATENQVKQAQDLRALFECLEVDKKWNDLHFLDVAIRSLPPEASKEKDGADLVLGQYKSYLRAYTKAVSIKEGKSVHSFLQRKCGREEKLVLTEITVGKDVDEYTCHDLLELWTLFLIETLEIPEDRITFCRARAGNSTTLVFMLAETCTEWTKEKLSKPAAVWVMKELDILRVYVAGIFNLDLRADLPNMLIANIREGLHSGVNFVSLTKDWSPLMCSLVDQLPEPKETQLSRVQPHSARPAELSVPEPVVEASSSTMLLKDLLVASKDGRLHEVQSLLDGGQCKVNDEDEEGFTAILCAALKGHVTIVQTLVEQYGGNVLHRKKGGRNAFLLCAMGGHLAVSEYLTPKMEGHLFDSDDDGNTALHWAAYFGHFAVVKYLVRSCGFDVKTIDKRGSTPLLRAAQKGHAEVARFLLENGSDVQEQNHDGLTAVLLAARYGHKEVVRELCETFHANILHRMKERHNAFLLCAVGGHLAVAEYLAPKMGDDIFDTNDNGSTALHWVAQKGHLSIVKYLVRPCGFDVKAVDKWGNTPLLRAAQEGHTEVACFLLENGSTIEEQNNDGWTAVLLAARYGHKEVVQELCETFEADLLHRKKGGSNAFLLCAEGGHLVVAEYLAPKMEGHLFDSDDNGYTALHWAAQEGQLSMVEYLERSCGFNVKTIDKCGNTPLLRATAKGHAEVACLLLENGSDVEEENNDGWTAVLLAACYGHKEVVQKLCETFQADILHRKKGGLNAFLLCAIGGHLVVAEYFAPKMEGHLFDSDDDGYTALHWAAQVGQMSMVEYLVRSCGFDVKAKNKYNSTPLLRATANGHGEVARFLLENGSQVQEQDSRGNTPLLRAAQGGHAEVARFLLENGSVFYERNSDGESALQIAVREGHLDVVKVLVQVYRDLHMENEVDQYYMDLADDYHHEHLVEYFANEFPTLKRKVQVPQPRPTMYSQVWSISDNPDFIY